MTPDDRELLRILRNEEQFLRRSLARLEIRLGELEARAGITDSAPVEEPASSPPPIPFHGEIPAHTEAASTPPPIPAAHVESTVEPAIHLFPPIPETEGLPPVPPPDYHPLPPIPPAAKPSFEFQIGRWLTRIGALFFVLALVSAYAYFQLYRFFGPWGKLGVMGAVSVIVVAVGQRLERKRTDLIVYGHTLMAAGLAGLYFTLYAAAALEPLRVVHQPVMAGFLLLLWSAYVFYLADRRQSQLLSIFAIVLAYVSSALNPLVSFTLVADLLLAATAVIFLLRNGWTTLSYLGMAGTYLALLRRLILNDENEFIFDTSRSLDFAPHAIYLIGAWVIFTAAVLLARAPGFAHGKRFAFLTLNNGIAVGLLVLTAYISGYGTERTGDVLFFSGLALLVTAGLAARFRDDMPEVIGAYVAQGIAVTTGGLMALYSGSTRSILLLIETLFLGLAGVFGRSRILTVCAWVTAGFTTLFSLWEIGIDSTDPWLLGFVGAVVMLKLAWWSRKTSGARDDPRVIVLPSSYYCVLGLGLLAAFLDTELNATALPPMLALAALVLTFSVYFFRLHELPPVAQTLLLGAQALVLFPTETGETLPWWSTALVAVATLGMVLWWTFQCVTRHGPWLKALDFVYALALVGLAYQAVRPHLHEQLWMIDASLLSVAFLAFGALTRVWSIAAMGQVFLAISLYHFFGFDADFKVFRWTAWAAAIPIAVVFATGRGVHAWLRAFPAIVGEDRLMLRMTAYAYQSVVLFMLVRAIIGLAPAASQPAAFILLGTIILTRNVRHLRIFGVRCSYALSLLGAILYASHLHDDAKAVFTFLNTLVIFSFLTQPAILAHAVRQLGTEVEAWLLVLISAATGWLYFSDCSARHWGGGAITVSWAAYALVLFLIGLFLYERRQRWCGLSILVAAIIRVFAVDFWGLSNGYRVLTFLVLTIITLGLGFIYARYSERLKTLL